MYFMCMLYAFICLLYVYYMYIKFVLYAYHIILYVHSMLYYTRCTFNVELSMCMFKSWVEYGAVPKNMAYAVTPLRKRYDHCIFLKMVHCVQMGKKQRSFGVQWFSLYRHRFLSWPGTDFLFGVRWCLKKVARICLHRHGFHHPPVYGEKWSTSSRTITWSDFHGDEV